MLLIMVTHLPALSGDTASTRLFIIQKVPSRRQDTEQASSWIPLVTAIRGADHVHCTCSIEKALTLFFS